MLLAGKAAVHSGQRRRTPAGGTSRSAALRPYDIVIPKLMSSRSKSGANGQVAASTR